MCRGIGDAWSMERLHRRTLRIGKKNMRHRSKTLELGLWFDYPLCCIRAFRRVRSRNRTPEQVRCIAAMKKSGKFAYIPCNDCACKYLQTHCSHLTM